MTLSVVKQRRRNRAGEYAVRQGGAQPAHAAAPSPFPEGGPNPMAMISLKKQPMPQQAPDVRATNFDEVPLGYTLEMAVHEATRCLQCQDPQCETGCPVSVPIRDFIGLLAQGRMEEVHPDHEGGEPAAGDLRPGLPAGGAVRGPLRAEPQRSAARRHRPAGAVHRRLGAAARPGVASATPKRRPEKVAVIGAGPAGLTCAGDLAALGYQVTVFEALHAPGGVLMYGIPEFRLPKEIVEADVARLEAMGVEFRYNVVVGRTITIDALLNEMGYDAVFIGTGAGLPRFMGIPGENLAGRLLGQRVPHPDQPDAGLPLPRVRHADQGGQAGCGDRRRQHGHGRRPHRPAGRRRASDDRLPPHAGGNDRPGRGVRARPGGRRSSSTG